MENNNDQELVKIAKSRAFFKKHLTIFLLGNVLIWLVWILLRFVANIFFPWALFPSVAWGVALCFHYFLVFRWNEKAVEKELERLKREIADKNTK